MRAGALRRDFEHRRLRNHVVNLRAIDLLSQGTLETLLVTSDDTAPYATGTLEQRWLKQWARALPHEGTLMFYPGADEVGSILVARALHRRTALPTQFAVVSAIEEDMQVTPAYANAPLTESVPRQIRAAGGDVVADADQADVLFVVHPAHPGRLDAEGAARNGVDPEAAHATAKATADLVERALTDGAQVALADVRYSNGADAALIEELRDRGLLDGLLAYGGWNTAGNTIGSVVAAAAATIMGRNTGTVDEDARKKLLVYRLVEDYVYQSKVWDVVREDAGLADHGVLYPAAAAEARAVEQATELLNVGLPGLRLSTAWQVGAVSFPWHRTFEVEHQIKKIDSLSTTLMAESCSS
jgi:hypothetical protein